MIDFNKKVDDLSALIQGVRNSKIIFGNGGKVRQLTRVEDFQFEERITSPEVIENFIEEWFLLCETQKEIDKSFKLISKVTHRSFSDTQNIDKIISIAAQLKNKVASEFAVKKSKSNKEKRQPGLLTQTVSRRKNYFDTYKHFIRIDRATHNEAVKKTITKHGISEKTLYRAIANNTP